MGIFKFIISSILVAAIPLSSPSQEKSLFDLDMSFGRGLNSNRLSAAQQGASVEKEDGRVPIANFRIQIIPKQ
ncbi:hypothetical protein DSO57_1029459 [Entomophthora muscae]|uniref:Uncharacterized protein n=1 Tax=Entomophthora muscae TaxID=34485 RepID=A0ACC2T185_9FUNG|nr:hypothetical protein DSO57_1029459 [Entomophthora muscae]